MPATRAAFANLFEAKQAATTMWPLLMFLLFLKFGNFKHVSQNQFQRDEP
jgi:hypothetical protein